MNVFIDTNMFLDFYRLGNDNLAELEKVFALHTYGRLKLWVPKLIKDEFWRNRGKVVAEHIGKIKDDVRVSFPKIVLEHEKMSELGDSLRSVNALKSEIIKDIEQKFIDEILAADIVIKKIFEKAHLIPTTVELLEQGRLRFDLGNPPGKNSSYGDAVNWISLLTAIPDNEDIHLITEDKDYKSSFIKGGLNEYLKHEWNTKKQSHAFIYSRLSEFTKAHYPEAENLVQLEKNILIKQLEESGSFASTHYIIEDLNKIDKFTPLQMDAIFDAYINNSQVGWIVTDSDVNEFGKKILSMYDNNRNPEKYERMTNMLG